MQTSRHPEDLRPYGDRLGEGIVDGTKGCVRHLDQGRRRSSGGYKWSDLKRDNADLPAKQADLGWQDARGHLRRAHGELTDFLEARTDAELYGGPMAGANNDWTPGRWAESAGASHYRSAGRYVRSRLRAST